MIPYGQHSINEEDVEAVADALRADRITQGEYVEKFERALCDYFGCDHAVVVNSGTTALHLAYTALGVDEGDEVITSPNTFVATANGILYSGGIPRFVDINPETFNLDVDRLESFLEDPENRENVTGIAPVHFAGLPCDMEKIYELAKTYDLFVLEDACHAPGAEWKDSGGNWHQVGSCSYSDAAVFSFHPVKHFTTGEGGAVLTNNGDVARKISRLRHHGITKDAQEFDGESDGPWYYEMQSLGRNGRITDFQCALGINQLERLEERVGQRRELASEYLKNFNDFGELKSQKSRENIRHAYHLYVIQTNYRKELFAYLQKEEISPQVHYIPVHLQPYFQEELNLKRGDFPVVEKYYNRAMTIPLYPDLNQTEQQKVIETVRKGLMAQTTS